jgi:uncharacterized lipoprotein NlpE involved in copper resistance
MRNLTLFTVLIFLLSCQNQSEQKAVQEMASPVDSLSESERNAVRQSVSYSGYLPCADCDGVEVIINLFDDQTYERRDLYMGRKSTGPGSNEINTSGSWMMMGDTLHLSGIKDGPDKYIRSDSSLLQLDQEGKRIEGKLADKYILKRVK